MRPEDAMDAIAACWCDVLADSVGGTPAQCCVTAGPPATVDCCAGVAWVRLVGAFPSVAFPSPETRAQRCIVDTWAMQVEVGITRCAPQPCDPTGATCCDEQADAAAVLLDDWRRARQLWTCGCIGLAPDEIVQGALKVYGPEGGCVGITSLATIRVSD